MNIGKFYTESMGKRMLCLLAVLALLLCGCGGKGEETTQPGPSGSEEQQNTVQVTEPRGITPLELVSTEEQGAAVAVTTTYCRIQYPFALSDLIRINPVTHQDQAALEFFGLIGGEQFPLFTLWFNGQGAIPLGTMRIEGEDAPVSVSAEIFEIPGELDDAGRNTFNAAQEIFNDVIVSLEENEGFVPAA